MKRDLDPAPVEGRGIVFIISGRVALLFVVVVIVGFVLGGWRLAAIQSDYTNQIAKTALRVSCESGNDFRSLDKNRWDGVVALFGKPPHRRDLQYVIDVIQAQTNAADVQRDCNHVSVQTPPPTATTTTTKATVPSTTTP